MDRKIGKINRNLVIGWAAIVVILVVTYFIEYLKGSRTIGYVLLFFAVTIVPAAVGLVFYFRDKTSGWLKYYALGGYTIMYVFVLMTSNTIMVFSYIIPMMALIVLYHSPKLVLAMGVISLAANGLAAVRFLVDGIVAKEDIRNIEIQFAVIIYSFVFAYLSSVIYNDIVKENEKYLVSINEKQKQLERVTLQTITTIANIIDAKDEYTKGHSYRVAEYSSMLAEELGYSPERVSDIKYIGLLHDIGKIGIPDSILNKPGKLSDSEYALMRKHAEIGGNILEGNNMLVGIDQGAKYHHERFDGRGYPEGLKGEDIPEIARIIGIADAYDAMTSNRIYRKRLTDETVMSEIKRSAGTQFDPRIAGVFVKMIEDGKLEKVVADGEIGGDSTSRAEQSVGLLSNIIGFKSSNYDSDHDYLTGVYSRKTGRDIITEALNGADGGLFIADIYNLRGINERHGIVAGDKIIKITADALRETENLVVARYDGSGFLCFMPGIIKREEFEEFITGICSKVKQKLSELKECDGNYLRAGGALSSELGRDIMTLVSAADKALFHIKQLNETSCYLYSKTDSGESQEIYKVDLGQLIDMVKCDNDIDDVPESDSEDFLRVYNLVKGIYYDNSGGDVRLLLLTVMPSAAKPCTIADRDEAMSYLESAINNLPEIDCVSLRFTSVQFLVVLTELGESSALAVRERILNSFYKAHNKNNLEIKCEIEKL